MQTTIETPAPPLISQTLREMLPHTLPILIVALLARLLVLWFVITRFPHHWLYAHGMELGTLAQSLAIGRGLSSPFGGSTGPTALLAPGYPALIALFFRLCGPFTFAAAIAVMAMQLLFNVMTVLVMISIARPFFGARAANLAGIFWAVSLPLIWMPTIFWETCLSTLLLISMIALALLCQRKPGFSLWALIGTYCALAALVNPALLPSLLAISGWAAWQTRRIHPYPPFLGLLLLFLVFAPWPLRNARALHAFIPLRSTIGFELWVGNRPKATGFLDESQSPIFNKHEYDDYSSNGEVAYMRKKSSLAETYILTHPWEFARLSAMRFIRFWTGTGNKDGSLIFAAHAILTTVLGLSGVWRLVRARRLSLAMSFILPLILFPLPYYITHAEFRYRLVVDPLLTILAAYAVDQWINRFRKDGTKAVPARHVEA